MLQSMGISSPCDYDQKLMSAVMSAVDGFKNEKHSKTKTRLQLHSAGTLNSVHRFVINDFIIFEIIHVLAMHTFQTAPI